MVPVGPLSVVLEQFTRAHFGVRVGLGGLVQKRGERIGVRLILGRRICQPAG
jgi:hypothetical protein